MAAADACRAGGRCPLDTARLRKPARDPNDNVKERAIDALSAPHGTRRRPDLLAAINSPSAGAQAVRAARARCSARRIPVRTPRRTRRSPDGSRATTRRRGTRASRYRRRGASGERRSAADDPRDLPPRARSRWHWARRRACASQWRERAAAARSSCACVATSRRSWSRASSRCAVRQLLQRVRVAPCRAGLRDPGAQSRGQRVRRLLALLPRRAGDRYRTPAAPWDEHARPRHRRRQWFVNLRDNPRLGRDYSVFGEVVEGWTSWTDPRGRRDRSNRGNPVAR